MKKKADRRKTATKEAKIPKTHEPARVRRRSCRLKNKSAATGSNLEDLRAAQRKQQQSGESLVTPIIVRKGVSSNDFRIFAKDISRRLENEGKNYAFQKKDVTKEDILKVRDYDVSNKQLPPSRPLTPASSQVTRPPRDSEPQLDERDMSLPAASEETSSSATTATIISYDNTDESASPHGETSRNSANSYPSSKISSAMQTEENGNEEVRPDQVVTLPQFEGIEALPAIAYNNTNPVEFKSTVDKIYEEMVTWKKNLFMLPTGKVAKDFIVLVTEWLRSYNTNSLFQGLAIKVVMILPSLLLQKPSATSKVKEHSRALGERLQFWKEGKFDKILQECRVIQKKLSTGKKRSQEDVSRTFSKLVFEGKLSSALKFL